MSGVLYLPVDEFLRGGPSNPDLASDGPELSAAFSSDGLAFTAQIVDAPGLPAEADVADAAADAASGVIARDAAVSGPGAAAGGTGAPGIERAPRTGPRAEAMRRRAPAGLRRGRGFPRALRAS